MTIDPNSVQFYYGTNLTNPAKIYKVGDSVAFDPTDQDNDKYMSCEIGSNCWVNTYQHNDYYNSESGAHEVLKSGVHNDLSSLKGLSMFQVIQNQFSYATDIRLTVSQSVDLNSNTYQLTLIPYQQPPVSCQNTNDGIYTQCGIPLMTPPDAEIVCQVSCQQIAWPRAVVSNGSIYFKYDPSTGLLSYDKKDGYPSNMSISQEGFTQFAFHLDSVQN